MRGLKIQPGGKYVFFCLLPHNAIDVVFIQAADRVEEHHVVSVCLRIIGPSTRSPRHWSKAAQIDRIHFVLRTDHGAITIPITLVAMTAIGNWLRNVFHLMRVDNQRMIGRNIDTGRKYVAAPNANPLNAARTWVEKRGLNRARSPDKNKTIKGSLLANMVT